MTGPLPCLTCELVRRRDRGGWLVLVARRHIEAIDKLTDEEAAELGVLLQRVSATLRQVTGCTKTYVVQFAEAAEHPHVHFHVIPRMADQPDARRGPGIFGYLGVPDVERVSEKQMNSLAAHVRDALA